MDKKILEGMSARACRVVALALYSVQLAACGRNTQAELCADLFAYIADLKDEISRSGKPSAAR